MATAVLGLLFRIRGLYKHWLIVLLHACKIINNLLLGHGLSKFAEFRPRDGKKR